MAGNSQAKFLSHRYIQIYNDGNPNHANIILNYQGSGGTPYDLDMVVYKEGYIFGDISTQQSSSSSMYPENGGTVSWPGHETINLSNAPVGSYLIDISAYVTSGMTRATTNFYLQYANGEYLCP